MCYFQPAETQTRQMCTDAPAMRLNALRLASPSDAGAARAAAVKRIPIWERLSAAPSAGVKEKAAAPQQKAMAPIALKTFSPTLGSLSALMPGM